MTVAYSQERALTKPQAAKSITIIATYNEALNILPLIESILAVDPWLHVLVVDDNSPDGTGKIVETLAKGNERVHLISRQHKRGYGTAVIEGIVYAVDHGFERLVTMDGDWSHDPLAITGLLQALEQYDMVIGSRYVDGIRILNWSIRRLLLSISANIYVRSITGLPYHDCTSGYRAYRHAVFQRFPFRRITSNGYSFLVELLFAVHKSGASIVEVPIVFHERRHGQSKISKNVILESAVIPWKLRIFGTKSNNIKTSLARS